MTFHLFIKLILDKSNHFLMYFKLFKPIIDFFIAFIGLIILLPLFLMVTILLFFSNKGYPFFIQYRPGKKGKVFKIYKFKTMTEAKDKNGKLLPDKDRLTVIGNFVRKSSLDEIPQLINVLKGDMSLIGPRPLLTRYLHLYSDFQNRRHEVKPGITGWAQVNGRNAISWKKKFQYDVWYVDNLSLSLDFKIFLKTIQKVLKRDGINSANSATIEPFEGD
jgi:undecaprenyl phosphate N,N'-diacetylbacillosamine 1-phosphate transferase